jgi:hypothetical protein
MTNINSLVTLLEALIKAGTNERPPAADRSTEVDLDAYDISRRFTSLANITIAVADRLYMSAGGSNDPLDNWMTREGHKVSYPAATPLGVIVREVIEGLLYALVLADAYEFGWVDDDDKFLKERLGQLASWIKEYLEDREDPVLTDMLDYLEQDMGITPLFESIESFSRNTAPASAEDSALIERWSRLAGILIKESK